MCSLRPFGRDKSSTYIAPIFPALYDLHKIHLSLRDVPNSPPLLGEDSGGVSSCVFKTPSRLPLKGGENNRISARLYYNLRKIPGSKLFHI
jgi:hypothetical protein